MLDVIATDSWGKDSDLKYPVPEQIDSLQKKPMDGADPEAVTEMGVLFERKNSATGNTENQ